MLLTGKKLHLTSQAAFDSMDRMSLRAGENTTEFNERQFVFELGEALASGAVSYGRPVWTAYEYRYPGDNGSRDRTRCDIVLRELGDGATGDFTWIEVKSTGLDTAGYWNNGFAKLRWRHDIDKLRGIGNVWNAVHHKAWVWLYQFENYRPEVRDRWGTGTGWTRWANPANVGLAFGEPDSVHVRLSRVLHEIGHACPGAKVSLRPRVRAGTDFTAMLVTAIL